MNFFHCMENLLKKAQTREMKISLKICISLGYAQVELSGIRPTEWSVLITPIFLTDIGWSQWTAVINENDHLNYRAQQRCILTKGLGRRCLFASAAFTLGSSWRVASPT